MHEYESAPKGLAILALGHPIGASSIPVGKGSLEGNSVPLGGRFPKEGSAFLGTRLSLGKSSVLYLCSRLTSERRILFGHGRNMDLLTGQNPTGLTGAPAKRSFVGKGGAAA